MQKGEKIAVIADITVTVLIVLFLLISRKGSQEIVLETATVTTGNIANTVTATGTVEPVDQVELGTQVSGVIKRIYIDFNSIVKKGQLLAELDKTILRATIIQSKASLESANNELEYQSKSFNRVKKLYEKNLVSQESLEKVAYEYGRAKTAVDKTRAELDRARINLNYATILSPIDGIVLERAVDEGQTVAASLNAPILFTLARDLTKMQVHADIDEADIGQVRTGQKVSFTVDAYPDENFGGMVSQIRLNPTVTSNVVTYPLIVSADNADQKLMPGMTATIVVYTQEAANALTIPTKALRFRPELELMTAYMKKMGGRPGSKQSGFPVRQKIWNEKQKPPNEQVKNRRNSIEKIPDKDSANGYDMVWIKNGEMIQPVRVLTGITDATATAILEGLVEGDEVVLSMALRNGKKQRLPSIQKQASNPFMPPRPTRCEKQIKGKSGK